MKNNNLKLLTIVSLIIINVYAGDRLSLTEYRLLSSSSRRGANFAEERLLRPHMDPLRKTLIDSIPATKKMSPLTRYIIQDLKPSDIDDLIEQHGIAPFLEQDRKDGNTILHLAAAKVDLGMVMKLTLKSEIVRHIGKNHLGQTPLHLALQNKYLSPQDKDSKLAGTLLTLISSPDIELEARDKKGNTSLSLAVENNNETACNFLLGKKCNPNIRSPLCQGDSVLHAAIKLGYPNIANMLAIQEGINLNSPDREGKAPLTLAFNKRYIEFCQFLISRGANPNVPTEDDSHIIFSAIKGNYVPLVNSLIYAKDKACLLNIKHLTDGYTPLTLAFQRGNIDACRTLLTNGASPNIKTPEGNFFLLDAIKCSESEGPGEHKELVKDLIRCERTNLECRDSQGNNALDIAIDTNNMELLQLLAESHNPNIKTKKGVPFIIHALKNGHFKLTKSLIMNKAINIDVKDAENNNVIDLAIQSDNEDICSTISHISTANFKARMLHSAFHYNKKNLCKLLLPSNPNLEIDGEPILACVFKKGYADLCKDLIWNGANPNTKIDGRPILACAFEQNNTELCQNLLWKGANPNTEINDRPILACAFDQDNTELCQSLLYKGANPNIKTEDDEYLIFSAIEKGNTEVVNTILYCESVGDLELYLKNKAGQTLIDIAKDTKYSHPHLESAIDYRLKKQATKTE